MRRPRVRFTVRGMMIAVALAAIAIALLIAVVRYIDKALYEFYRPGGTLDRHHKSANKL